MKRKQNANLLPYHGRKRHCRNCYVPPSCGQVFFEPDEGPLCGSYVYARGQDEGNITNEVYTKGSNQTSLFSLPDDDDNGNANNENKW